MKRNFCISLIAGLMLLLCFNKGIAQFKPETLRQIQLLLDEKSSRTTAQRKMQSSLLQAARENRGEKMAVGVDLVPIQLNRSASGNINVDINGDISESLLSKIKSLGGEIIYPSQQYHTLRASIPLASVETIASYSEVKFIQPAVLSKTVGGGMPKQKPTTFLNTNYVANPSKLTIAERREKIKKQVEKYMMMLGTGSINSEGDHPHRADDARNTYGYLGQGVKIGVLSDSYNANNTAAASVASGDLPGTGNPLGNTTPVTVVQDITGATDEGQAMLQIVHDIAPKAQLFFATANVSEAGFASNIVALRNTYACDIIIDDVEYFDESPFQDGIVAQAVNTVTTAGAMYFSSAGNQGSLAKTTSSIFEGDFNSTGSPAFTPTGTKTGGTIHNFGTAASPINGDIVLVPELSTGTSSLFTLTWADPSGKSTNDYDLFLVSSTGTIKASSTTVQSGSSDPYEALTFATVVAGDRLVVYKTATAAVRAFSLNGQGSTFSVATNGQTHGHSCAANAFCIAATSAVSATLLPFTSSAKVESFSSDGPRRMFYNADGTAMVSGSAFTFADAKFTTRQKPDITAADGVSTSLSGFTPFYGTSAAAPHAGAIAALLKSANSSLTATQIKTILVNNALDIEGTGYDINSGSGIIQAYQSMQAINPTPLATLTLASATFTEGTGNNGNGSIDPGENGNLTLQLKNPSLALATNVVATVTSSTSGVTISQGTASFGNLASGATSSISVPFTFALNAAIACGSTVTINVSVSFGGGLSPAGFTAAFVVSQRNVINVSSTLGSTPPTGTGYTVTSGQQTGRISRVTTTISSTCDAPLANPGLAIATGSRQYDAYTFTNNTGASQCYTATITSSNAANLYSVAYSNAGFVPSNPSTNYVAEPAQGASVMKYSFTVAPGANATVVVHDVNETPASNSVYNLTITYQACACLATLVTSNADDGLGSLRYIIANSCANPVITFASNITNITLTSGELAINKAMTITGNGANVLTISGNKLSRIFNITSGTSTVSLSGMTIRDGKPQTGASAVIGGGGILINSGSVNITGCNIINNDASLATNPDGGGIENAGSGVVTINNSTIANNTADRVGGGIAQWGTLPMVLNNTTVTGNTVTAATTGVGYGGGIFVDSLINITNSTIYNNSGYIAGGNIFNYGATNKAFTTLTNTIVAGGSIASAAPAGNGRDIYSYITSGGYNLIQNTGGYVISGTTTGNIYSTSPQLFALGNYGGSTTTLLPMSNSPVVNAGNSSLTTGTDQRGFARVTGGRADIGAVETNYAFTILAGTPQSAIIKTAFATPLQAKVTESGNNIAGDSVTFVTPTIGPSATFANSSNNITVTTNTAGVATAPITANSVIGSYTAVASIGTAYSTISYALTNNLAANSPITIFPNPVVNNLTVGLPGTDLQTVNIYDILGRQMAQYSAAGGNLLVNTSGWARGMYLLTVTKGGSRIFTIKLIKE